MLPLQEGARAWAMGACVSTHSTASILTKDSRGVTLLPSEMPSSSG